MCEENSLHMYSYTRACMQNKQMYIYISTHTYTSKDTYSFLTVSYDREACAVYVWSPTLVHHPTSLLRQRFAQKPRRPLERGGEQHGGEDEGGNDGWRCELLYMSFSTTFPTHNTDWQHHQKLTRDGSPSLKAVPRPLPHPVFGLTGDRGGADERSPRPITRMS